jgi:hypothetical protein
LFISKRERERERDAFSLRHTKHKAQALVANAYYERKLSLIGLLDVLRRENTAIRL